MIIEYIILGFIITFLSGLFVVILKSTRNSITYSYCGAVLTALLWTVSILMTIINGDNPEIALWWTKVSFIVPLGIISSLYIFIHYFAGDKINNNFFKSKFNKTAIILIILAAIPIAFLIAYNRVVVSVIDLKTTFGPNQLSYIIYLVTAAAYLVLQLRIARTNSRGNFRAQTTLMSFGVVISIFLAILINLLLPFLTQIELRSLGPLSLLFFIFFTAYAILSSNLFDIRLVISKTAVYGALFALIIIGYLLLLTTARAISYHHLPQHFSEINWRSAISGLTAALLIGATLEPLRRFFQKMTDRFFYKEEYDTTSVLNNLSGELKNSTALEEALNSVMQILVRTLKLRGAISYILLHDSEGNVTVQTMLPIEYTNREGTGLEQNHFLIQYLDEHQAPINYTDIVKMVEEEKYLLEQPNKKIENLSKEELTQFIRTHAIRQSILKKMTTLDLRLILPITLNSQLISILFLGEKLSHDKYHPSDFNLIDSSLNILTNMIQKAKLYEGNQMKTEFISIASHELLTPISAMNGYLSMILDENIGHIDKKAREYLANAYISTQRLSLLVKDLLTVSRLDSGSINIQLKPIQIEDIIQDVIDAVQVDADKKRLALVFEKPSQPCPLIDADPTRVQEVLSNLLTNAIKYTPQGAVTVRLKAVKPKDKYAMSPGKVVVTVDDTGIGIAKNERAHMFQKFYRGDNDFTLGVMGTGLGLYIIKTTLEKMGGDIQYHSKSPHGSIFEFSLPISQQEQTKTTLYD